MNSSVKIIKRDGIDSGQSPLLDRREKTERQREREIANTVKNWITEVGQRRKAERLWYLSDQLTGVSLSD